MPIIGLLGVLFVTLKLLEVIDWAWIWVTAPFWGGLALVLAFALIVIPIRVLCSKKVQRSFNKRRFG